MDKKLLKKRKGQKIEKKLLFIKNCLIKSPKKLSKKNFNKKGGNKKNSGILGLVGVGGGGYIKYIVSFSFCPF